MNEAQSQQTEEKPKNCSKYLRIVNNPQYSSSKFHGAVFLRKPAPTDIVFLRKALPAPLHQRVLTGLSGKDTHDPPTSDTYSAS